MATAGKRVKPGGRASRHVRQAVGSYEAACLMGLHWSMPSKLHARGKLSAHVIRESWYVKNPSRAYAIYDGEECDRDFADYDAKIVARGGKSDRRPRSGVHLRPEVLRRLAAVETPIAFDDAVGLGEAAKILGVHPTFVPRLVAAGKVVGRVAWNPRGRGGTLWIISRRSCAANAVQTRKAEAAGVKKGRPRKVS